MITETTGIRYEGQYGQKLRSSRRFRRPTDALWHPVTFQVAAHDGGLCERAPLERGSSSDRTAASEGYEIYDQPINPFPEPSLRVDNFSLRSRIDWDIGNGISLAYVAGYQRLTDRYVGGSTTSWSRWSAPACQRLLRDFRTTVKCMKWISTMTLVAEERPWASYFYENSDDNRPTTSGHPRSNQRQPRRSPYQNAYGVFDQVTYSILDPLRLEAGVRYSHDRKSNPMTSLYSVRKYPAGVLTNFPPAQNVGFVRAIPLSDVPSEFQRTRRLERHNVESGARLRFSNNTLGFSMYHRFKEGSINEASPRSINPEKAINMSRTP